MRSERAVAGGGEAGDEARRHEQAQEHEREEARRVDDPRVKVAQLLRVRVDDEEHELDTQDDGRAQQVVQVYECVGRHFVQARVP